jgi:hypothetical protein
MRTNNIVDYIPKGRENKISRESLTMCTGLTDRVCREYISRARAEGHAIVGDPAGGYYIAETEADINLLLGELYSRIEKLAHCAGAVKAKGLAS